MKPGGQALADGVFMRTSLAWAIARHDGTVEVGTLPRPALATVPGARVLTGLGVAFKVSASRGMAGRRGASSAARLSRSVNRRFLAVLVVVEALMLAASARLDIGSIPSLLRPLAIAAPWILTLLVIRRAAPATIWRYHGAEHKAVAAFEAGIDLDDVDAVMKVSRIHNRCGTNLVTMMMVLGMVLWSQPTLVQLPLFALGVAFGAELLSQAARRPEFLPSRVLLAGGRFLQRYVTTAEPTRDEMVIGCRSLQACLAEHARVEAFEDIEVELEAAVPALASA